MLNLRLTSLLASMVLCGIFVSCNNEGEYKHGDEAIITEEVKARFTSLGFNVSDLTTTTGREMVDPAEESGVYLFDGDLVVSKSDLQNMLAGEYVEGGPRLEQYRTTNLVSQGRTINVIAYTGNNANGLDATIQTALRWAVDNYNALNINLNFTLTFGTNFSP
ncbi:MAG: zinc-dependent metalloprotease, partial [Cytophagales bacterium]|nr:zinc-dependent metalloprotease [Cytophagales bacterium]